MNAPAHFANQLTYEFRHAVRRLMKTPAFTLATVLLLAIGIGGTTLVFSVVDASPLRSLPLPAPDQLARIVEVRHNRPPVSEYPYGYYDEWHQRSRSFSATFAHTDVDVSYSDGTNSRPVRAQIVTGKYYSVLGVAPQLGRYWKSRTSGLPAPSCGSS